MKPNVRQCIINIWSVAASLFLVLGLISRRDVFFIISVVLSIAFMAFSMASRRCHHCKKRLKGRLDECPYCGRRIE